MGTLTPAQLAQLAYAAGFRNGSGYQGKGLTWAVAIALAESGGNPTARGVNSDSHHSVDRGLWQINSYWHREVSDAQAYSPGGAATAAFKISKSGNDWHEWATFTNGKGAAQLGRAALAAAGAAGGSSAQNASWWNDPNSPFQLPGMKDPSIPVVPDPTSGLGALGLGGAIGGFDAIGRSLALIASSWLRAAMWLSNPHNWQRVALVIGGGAAALIGLSMLANSGIGGPVGGVARAASGAGRVAKKSAGAAAQVGAAAATGGGSVAAKGAATAAKAAKTASAAKTATAAAAVAK